MFSFIIFISPSINHHLNEDIWCQKTYLPCRAKFASPEVYSVGGISISITYRRKWAAPGCRARPPPHRALSDSIVSLSARPAMSCQCHSIRVLRNQEPAVSCLQCSWKLQTPGTAPQELWWGRYPKNRHCWQTPEVILMCRLKLETHQVRGILLNSLLAEVLPALCGISRLPDNLLFWNLKKICKTVPRI